MKVSKTQDLMLTLVRLGLFGAGGLKGVDDEELRAAFYEAAYQTVLPISYAGFRRNHAGATLSWAAGFYSQIVSSVYQNEIVNFIQSEILNQMKGIECVVLKGTSVAIDYPDPVLRTMGDIDLLIHKRDLDRARKRMEAIGFRAKEQKIVHHLKMFRKEFLLELHIAPGGLPKGKIGNYLFAKIESGLSDVRTGIMNGEAFPMLPDLQQALTLLLHMQQHLQCSGMGLRQLCDWMMFLDKRLTVPLWKELYDVLHRAGLYKFTCVMTKICVLYLGLNGDKVPWCETASEELCDKVLEDILASGNMGSLNGELLKSRLISDGQSRRKQNLLINAFRNLQQMGAASWPAVQKHIFLRPFAWAYLIIRYAYLIITGKRSIKSAKTMLNSAHNIHSLFQQLEVFVVDRK